MDDAAAAEQLESYNKVHCLFGDLKVHTRDDLMSKAGESPEGLVKCLGYLKKKDYIQTEGFGSDKKYKITDIGRLQLPPDIIQPEQVKLPGTKRIAKKPKIPGKPRVTGQVHFKGLTGKFNIDKKGAVILDKTTNMGRLYFALNGEMTANELAKVTGITLTSVWYSCKILMKMGCFSFIKKGATRYYVHGATKVAHDIETSNSIKTPIPLKVVPEAPEHITPQKPPLEQDLDELLKRYNLMEVFLEVFTRVDESYRDLYQFKQSLVSSVGGKNE